MLRNMKISIQYFFLSPMLRCEKNEREDLFKFMQMNCLNLKFNYLKKQLISIEFLWILDFLEFYSIFFLWTMNEPYFFAILRDNKDFFLLIYDARLASKCRRLTNCLFFIHFSLRLKNNIFHFFRCTMTTEI